jgi:DnaJ-class molecular chaperone
VTSHYETLGVSETATAEEIKVAFKRLATQFHPDANVGATEPVRQMAEAKFKEINTAHTALADAGTRAAYDIRLAAEKRGAQRQQATKKRPEKAIRIVRPSAFARRALRHLDSELSSSDTTPEQRHEASTTILKFEAAIESRREKTTRINDGLRASREQVKKLRTDNANLSDALEKAQATIRKQLAHIRSRNAG